MNLETNTCTCGTVLFMRRTWAYVSLASVNGSIKGKKESDRLLTEFAVRQHRVGSNVHEEHWHHSRSILSILYLLILLFCSDDYAYCCCWCLQNFMSSTFALLFELLCARDDFWHHGYSNRLRRLDDDDDMSDIVTTASFIGIIVAISGNMLISLALNCQKLAHRRLEREREAHSKEVGRSRKEQRPLLGERRLSIASEHHIAEEPSEHEDMNDEQDEEDDDHTRVGELSQHQSPDSDLESNYGELIPFPGQSTPSRSHQTFRDRAHSLLLETEPLLIVSAGTSPRGSVRGGYGSRDSSIPSGGSPRAKIRTRPSLLSRLFSHGTKGKQKAMTTEVTKVAAIPADIRANGSSNGTREDSSSNRQRQRLTFAEPANGSGSNSGVDEANESDYLKSKLWCVTLFI